jgi:RNA polymerase sigma-70 factor (ECF subfamily)
MPERDHPKGPPPSAFPGPGLAGVLQRAAEGAIAEPLSLDAFLEAHAGRAFRIALGITRSPSRAEAALRAAFLPLVAGGATAGEPLARWLCRAVTREALRRTGPIPLRPPGAGARRRSAPPRGSGTPREPADWSRAADLLRVGRAAVERAVDRLPGRERAALVLVDGEGLPVELLAKALAEPPAAARRRLHRARLAVREAIGAQLAAGRLAHPPGDRA